MTTGPAPPPPPGAPATAPPSHALPKMQFGFRKGLERPAQKIVISGRPGIGKTELASMLPKPAFIDANDGAEYLGVEVLPPPNGTWDWPSVRAAINADIWEPYQSIIIDTATDVQRLASQDIVANRPDPKTKKMVDSIDGYLWGVGAGFLFSAMELLLTDLDRHVRAGRHVALITHSCIGEAPNPDGENWIRYEPDLYDSKRYSVRNSVVGWASQVLHIGYDVHAEEGKAKGSGSRTIYTREMPTHVAKTRPAIEPIVYTQGSDEIWRKIGCLS